MTGRSVTDPTSSAGGVAGRYRRTAMTPKRRPAVAAVECCEVPAPATHVAAPDDDALAAMSKALGHPARIKILRMSQGATTV